MTAYALPILQDSSLSSYIQEVNKFPMLDEKEEFALAMRFKLYNDVASAHKLVTSHLRLVVKIAMSFRGYGLPMADVISEGNIGLMTAVRKFEVEKGFRLSTYAMWWIKAAINEFVLKSWSIVKVGTSANQKKLFFNLKRLKNKINSTSTDSAPKALTNSDADAIAKELNVDAQEVIDMDQLMMGGGESLNAMSFIDGEEEQIDFLEDNSPSQEIIYAEKEEKKLDNNLLKEAIATLNEREKEVILKRRLLENPLTLDDLSKVYGVSKERIRQIEGRALEKLQSFMLGKRQYS